MKTSDISDREILEAVEAFHASTFGQTPDEALAAKYPVKVIMSKMNKMDTRGLIDYGVSLRGAWITDKGRDYLKSLR